MHNSRFSLKRQRRFLSELGIIVYTAVSIGGRRFNIISTSRSSLVSEGEGGQERWILVRSVRMRRIKRQSVGRIIRSLTSEQLYKFNGSRRPRDLASPSQRKSEPESLLLTIILAHNEPILCPFCGYMWDKQGYRGDEFEIECPKCNTEFRVRYQDKVNIRLREYRKILWRSQRSVPVVYIDEQEDILCPDCGRYTSVYQEGDKHCNYCDLLMNARRIGIGSLFH